MMQGQRLLGQYFRFVRLSPIRADKVHRRNLGLVRILVRRQRNSRPEHTNLRSEHSAS